MLESSQFSVRPSVCMFERERVTKRDVDGARPGITNFVVQVFC